VEKTQRKRLKNACGINGENVCVLLKRMTLRMTMA